MWGTILNILPKALPLPLPLTVTHAPAAAQARLHSNRYALALARCTYPRVRMVILRSDLQQAQQQASNHQQASNLGTTADARLPTCLTNLVLFKYRLFLVSLLLLFLLCPSSS